VVIAYGYRKVLRTFGIYKKFELLEVKVPNIFLGTRGFSLRRDGRYSLTCSTDKGPTSSKADSFRNNIHWQDSILSKFIH
jgi:hypothetical protein